MQRPHAADPDPSINHHSPTNHQGMTLAAGWYSMWLLGSFTVIMAVTFALLSFGDGHYAMGEGEISPVFTTQLGFHVCTVTGRRPAVARPFAEVQDDVKNRFLEEYRDKKFNAFLEELKAAAKVEDTDPEGANCGH